jgi:hypothetical protein
MAITALAVSDEVDGRIHTASIRERMKHVDLVFGCGDIPASYLEFLADALDRPVYYVLGNHQEELTRGGERGKRFLPQGGTDLGGRVLTDSWTGLILAGLPGSPRYSNGPQQFTEFEMFLKIARMIPRLLWNRWRHGRALDVLITHAPARDVGDREDLAHRGFKAVRWFLERFRPAYHLHGHIHLWDRSQGCTQVFGETLVVNVYPYHLIELSPKVAGRAPAAQQSGIYTIEHPHSIAAARQEPEPPR